MPPEGRASLLLVDDDPDLLRADAGTARVNGFDVTEQVRARQRAQELQQEVRRRDEQLRRATTKEP